MSYLTLYVSPVVVRDNIQAPCHMDAFIFKILNINATSGNKVFYKSVFHAEFKSQISSFNYGACFF